MGLPDKAVRNVAELVHSNLIYFLTISYSSNKG